MSRTGTRGLFLRRVPADLWLQVRKTCLERGISAREFVIEAIRKAVRTGLAEEEHGCR